MNVPSGEGQGLLAGCGRGPGVWCSGRVWRSESEQMFLLIKNSNQRAHLFELIMADVSSEEIMKVLSSSQLLAECLLWLHLVNTLD